MKKLAFILAIISLFLFGCITTSKIMIPKEQIKTEICAFETQIKTNEIFLACHEFLIDEFSSYNGVLKYQDKETGTLLLNWKTKIQTINAPFQKNEIWLNCSSKIRIEENIITFEHRVIDIVNEKYVSRQYVGYVHSDTYSQNELDEKDLIAFKTLSLKLCDDLEKFLNRY